jgi:phosphatidylethanolamine/phosphatidyl-N-methylethanolamine N-methyltransferase
MRLNGRRIDLFRMNAERMRFADGVFDCVTVPYTLSVTPDSMRFVREIRRVCKPDGSILIVNHFSGGRVWPVVDRTVRPLARRLGVRADFRFDEQILSHDWQVVATRPVNLFGLSTLVEIRNGR